MIKKLKDILNTYSDDELNDMTLWVNAYDEVKSIIIDEDFCLDLITDDAEIKVNNKIEKERK